jgi:leucyl-tRNA synthetase
MITKNVVKMSKSKGNTVSPDDLIDEYGADTVRLYTLFIGPPEKDAEWSDRGVEGAFRFLGRVWRLIEKVRGSKAKSSAGAKLSQEEINLRRKIHLTIKKVTDDLDGGFHFNTAISSIMELVNESYDLIGKASDAADSSVLHEAAESVIVLLAPFVPHIAEEMWQLIGKKNSIFRSSWPAFDKDAIVEEIITIPVQINGKLRSTVEAPFDINEEALKDLVLADPKVNKWTAGNAVKKFIVVPKKLVNIVV